MRTNFLPHFSFLFNNRPCRNDHSSLLKRFFCWLIGCCTDEADQ